MVSSLSQFIILWPERFFSELSNGQDFHTAPGINNTLFLENKEEMRKKKKPYRAMFLNWNEVHMPNFSYF